MTPHARRVSLLQAALQASSVSAASASASASASTSSSSSSPTSPTFASHPRAGPHPFLSGHRLLYERARRLGLSPGHLDLHAHSRRGPQDEHAEPAGDDRGAGEVDPAAAAAVHRKLDAPDDQDDELRRRQATGSAVHVTEVVQTISVVQVIDGHGSVVTMQTLNSPTTATATAANSSDATSPALADGTSLAASAGLTVSLGATGTGTATSPTSVAASGLPGSGSASAAATTTEPFVNNSNATIAVTTSGVSSSSFILGTGGASAASLGSAAHNASASASASGHLFNNTTAPYTLFANTSRTLTTSSSSSLFSSSSVFSSSFASSASSVALSSSSEPFLSSEPTGTAAPGGATDGGTAAGTAGGAAPTASTTAGADASASSGPPTSVLVGSVIGGLAGLALLLVVALFLLRWKRQRSSSGHKLLGDGSGAAGSGGASGGGGGSGSGGGMSGNPTAFLMPLAAALALKPKRSSRSLAGAAAAGGEAASSDAREGGSAGGAAAGAAAGGSAERGFYRVSGKKLPSVLQHGGDGYEDPRESMVSVNTTAYRDSAGFFGGAGGPATTPSSRYAVGSPMRPESGVPVFQPGPSRVVPMRVPLSRQGSAVFDDGASSGRNLTPPPALDPIGRSLVSQDTSRGSGSRFTEDIS